MLAIFCCRKCSNYGLPRMAIKDPFPKKDIDNPQAKQTFP